MAKTQQKGLGRGFDSLLPQNFDESLLLTASDRIEKIPVDKLVPNQYQPRKEFADEALRELADSIKEYGVLQPLIVTPHQTDQGSGYMLIAGERRWRASRLAGQKTVPAIVRTMKELERLEIALIENVQRVDLSPLEQAESIEYLHRQFGTSYTEIAKRLGKANSTVANIVRLMQLPDEAKEALRNGAISEGHARAVLALKGDAEKQAALLKHIVKHGWTVRQAEQFVVSVREGHQEAKKTPERMHTETPATKRLGKRLGAPVFIRRTAKGGKLEVVFKTDDELQKILDLISG
jgi:ParB family transcriptional regulator, chromosome partitioning protein